MFGLFKNRSSSIKVIDKVWMSRQAKHNACMQMLQMNPDCLFIAWFEETYLELQRALNIMKPEENLLMAHEAEVSRTQNRMVVFAEHYPLFRTEQALFEKLNLDEVPVLSSLDEPFFQRFGGERTIELMKKMGMKENEVVGHSMITKSIRRAQEKIEKYVMLDQRTTSQEAWFLTNTGKLGK